jgi:hypothetical protein
MPALPARPPEKLLTDLSQRLIPRSQAVGDEDLTAPLIQLEDRLVRWNRARDASIGATRRDIYVPPLLEVIKAANVP